MRYPFSRRETPMMTHEAAANTAGTPTNQAASPICQSGAVSSHSLVLCPTDATERVCRFGPALERHSVRSTPRGRAARLGASLAAGADETASRRRPVGHVCTHGVDASPR